MRILAVNDDGINARGLSELVSSLCDKHEVIVCAPDYERSAISHGITIRTPLRMFKAIVPGATLAFSASGTPADCVRLAISELGKFDAVFSGINHGANAGLDVMYSGTVSAAAEAALLNIPAAAVSIHSFNPQNFSGVKKYIKLLVKYIERFGVNKYGILNLNVPDLPFEEIRGLVITALCNFQHSSEYEKRLDPSGREYYWATSDKYEQCETESGSDCCRLMDGYATLTPLLFDLTDRKAIGSVSEGMEEVLLSEGFK